ncbi:DUF2716 domain-containing protein [Streptomyces virginiae]|uniref:DUF2716 domain-containing protein n=1 Tax=Streptomyces virginiae TaxID=1961 RepID=UPI00369B72B9
MPLSLAAGLTTSWLEAAGWCCCDRDRGPGARARLAAGHTTALLHRPEPRPPVQPLGALRPAVPGDRSTGVAGAARLGTFGHPWEQTLTVWGPRLLDAVEEELTVLLGEPIRRRDRGRTPRAVGGPTSRGVARRGRRPGGRRPPATG